MLVAVVAVIALAAAMVLCIAVSAFPPRPRSVATAFPWGTGKPSLTETRMEVVRNERSGAPSAGSYLHQGELISITITFADGKTWFLPLGERTSVALSARDATTSYSVGTSQLIKPSVPLST